jgi:hypothetical protein
MSYLMVNGQMNYLKKKKLASIATARALRATVFLGSLIGKTGRCAPPAPPIAASLILSTKLTVC